MGEVAYDLNPQVGKDMEIIVHVDETLGEQRRSDLVDALEGTDGVSTAEFCPLRYHLMLVQYDRDTISSTDVLARVKSQSVHAELIGPI